jgi:dienelactone hydrolase
MPTGAVDDRRAWWIDLLGAGRRAGGTWQLGAPRPGPLGSTWHDLRLRAFDDLTAVLLLPDTPRPVPVVVVPFYDTASLLGLPSPLYPPGGRGPERDYARRLVAHGLGALAVPWWAETAVPDDGPTDLEGRYGPPAAAHLARHPGVTGLGRSVADLRLAVDALVEVPGVDGERIGAFGHSLGGKLAMVLAAVDPRVRAAAVHEPGLGFAHSNWSDPWYLGDRVPRDRDLDDLLALVAPRPFLYGGGGASDGAHNAGLARSARQHWPGHGFDVLTHDGGHPLPDHVFAACATWMAHRLNYPREGMALGWNDDKGARA